MKKRLGIYAFNSDALLHGSPPPSCWAQGYRLPILSHSLFAPNPVRWVINLHFADRKLKQREVHLINCPRWKAGQSYSWDVNAGGLDPRARASNCPHHLALQWLRVSSQGQRFQETRPRNKSKQGGTSLVVQWLRLHASTTGGVGN